MMGDKSNEPCARAYTVDEVRQNILSHVRAMVKYWATQPLGKNTTERLDGLAFSLLVMIDGCSELPAMDLVMRPHPDNERFKREEGENWYQNGQVINGDVHLHDLWYK